MNCSVQKVSQAMLATNSSSPELLSAHAYLERSGQKYDKARKVYRVGLSSLSQTQDPSVVYLWWGLTEMEWLLSNTDAALESILNAAGLGNERSGISVLKAKRRLDELCRLESVPEWRFRVCWIKLRFLLELLTGPVEDMAKLAETLQDKERLGSTEHETLVVASRILVYQHTTMLRNQAPPSTLRNLVTKALEIYPDNSILFGLFLETEKGESVWGRVRSIINDTSRTVTQGKSVSRRIMELWTAKWEQGRWFAEIERARSGLEAAVISDR